MKYGPPKESGHGAAALPGRLAHEARAPLFDVQTLVLAPLFLALSLVAGRASDDRGLAVLGFGNKSCGTYVKARSERYGDSDYRGWLTGYLSARNGRFNGFYDLLEGSDLSGAMLWLENYCQSPRISIERRRLSNGGGFAD